MKDVRQFVFDEGTPDYATLTLSEVQEILRVGRTTLFRWRANGTFPEPQTVGGRLVYTVGCIRRYLRKIDRTLKAA